MRKREDMEGESDMSGLPHSDSLHVLEVLLDIREILDDIRGHK